MGLQDAITYLAQVVGAVDGIRQARDYPPESLNEFPFLVCYAQNGSYEFGPAGVMKGLHNLVADLYVARMDLPRDAEKLMAFSDSVPLAIMADPTLGGNVSTVGRITYQLLSQVYGSQDTLVIRWILENCKIQTNI